MIKKMKKTKNQRFLSYPYLRSHMNKRGGHVGIVLSFVIFVTFLVFLYTITEPAIKVDKGKEDLLEFLKAELINEFKEDMTSITLKIEESVSENCVIIGFDEIKTEEKIVVKDDETDTLLESSFEDGKVRIKINGAENIKVYSSKEFENGNSLSGCAIIDEEEYKIGAVRTTEEMFEKKIMELEKEISNGGYEAVKERLKIPSGDEFGFVFENGTRDVIAKTKEKEITTNIFVEEIPIQYIDNQANKKPGFLKIKVW